MKALFSFFPDLLRYKKVLVVALVCAVIEALCVAGGFGATVEVIDQLIVQENSLAEMVASYLSHEQVQRFVGDLSHWADYLPEHRWGGFVLVISLVWVFSVIGAAARFSHDFLVVAVIYRCMLMWRARMFRHLVSLRMSVVVEKGMVEQIAKVLTDASLMGRGYKALLSKAVRDALLGTTFLLFAFLSNWKLSLLFLGSAPVLAFSLWYFGRIVRKATRRAMNQVSQLLGKAVESVQGITVVKAYNAEHYERFRFNRTNRELYKHEMRGRLARSIGPPITDLIAITGVMVVACVASYMVIYMDVPGKDLATVLLSLVAAGVSYKSLAKLNGELQEASACAERVVEVLEFSTERDHWSQEKTQRLSLEAHRQEVVFDQVSFRYTPDSDLVLKDVSLRVPFGKVCAVVGPNGSGKSTLLNLLPVLFHPTEGRVLIDGHDLKDCRVRSVREQMAVVNQQTVIFDDSVWRNVRFGNRAASKEEIIKACQLANAHDFIMDLDEGYDTKLGEMGGRLSGGQRQRIAIARAVLRNPSILILDEATSQIDSESETRINEALDRSMEGRTTFIIAHRLSTVKDADLIVVMNTGRVEATGTHEELLQSSPTYQSLVSTQFYAETTDKPGGEVV